MVQQLREDNNLPDSEKVVRIGALFQVAELPPWRGIYAQQAACVHESAKKIVDLTVEGTLVQVETSRFATNAFFSSSSLFDVLDVEANRNKWRLAVKGLTEAQSTPKVFRGRLYEEAEYRAKLELEEECLE